MPDIPPNAPQARLCHVVKWPDFDGFGFNLHADKVRQGQFIGKVDDNSPAEKAGLKNGDKIIEVNGVNISNENHKQVVARIKAVPNETRLLVVDLETEAYYKERNIVVKGTLQNIRYAKTPARNLPTSHSSDEEDGDPEPVTAPKSSPATQINGQARRHSRSSTSSQESDNEHFPRFCHVIKWQANEGFGFHLLADKTKQGQYIGKVDANSPADTSGLRLGDRIIEVNGVNVERETHKEVVGRIKRVPLETKLLVVDPTTDTYYKERNRAIVSTDSNVRCLKTPTTRPASSSSSPSPRPMSQLSSSEDGNHLNLALDSRSQASSKSSASTAQALSNLDISRDRSPSPRPLSMSSNGSTSPTPVPGLDLPITAAEMRARLASRKKYDPRRDAIDLRRKHEIIQTM